MTLILFLRLRLLVVFICVLLHRPLIHQLYPLMLALVAIVGSKVG